MTRPTMDLRLTPHRSLGPQGFRILMLVFAGVCGLGALRFLALGAWPVFLFMLLDVALIYGAFRLNYRDGRRFEQVTLTPDLLTVRKVTPGGQESRAAFNPYWVRVELDEADRQLALRLHGQRVAVGQFLSPDERVEVKAEIERGLDAVRRYRPSTSLSE
ncbi:DUF2244 domain-containing protein [Hankyongella ginsenosidimutans]|uniref:DUF2244 domain-containing protein n=1 Tax=Hankyongella ginsenosidimutans TaxID=1763828 RepID=A0A4D7CC38_9SPHN|nr:DUF2244 domain-containing protein [Hankyongella ginsenosidimutans]QCI79642.1 DUF2244 domain-containing protein [Hankyongella ginsenosidimutans]